jgi:aspartate racemase
MKKLGLIGGTGPESTIEYYRQIEYGVQAKTGSFPNLTIESLSVFDVLRFCGENDYHGLAEYLLKGFQCLADAGADFASLTGITPHIVFDEISEKSPITVISIVDAACERAHVLGYRKIALLGTYPTMAGAFFQKTFQVQGIEVVTPLEDEMRYIGEKIETELELARVIPETQQRFCSIADRLVSDENVQAIVLGCTELPLILNDNLTKVPCLDVMKIHIEKLISLILEA